jgi:hypothetical protein
VRARLKSENLILRSPRSGHLEGRSSARTGDTLVLRDGPSGLLIMRATRYRSWF